MCHVRLADAEPSFAPPAPKKPGFWKTMGKTVTSVTEALVMMEGGRGWDAISRHQDNEAESHARKQAFFAITMAQAKNGTLGQTKPAAKPVEVAPPPPRPDEGHWACPRSGEALQSRTVSGMHMHINSNTGGFILETSSQHYLFAHPELWPEITQAADQLQAQARQAVDGRAAVYLNCPACSGPMSRKNFARVSGVLVDSCARHGTWFDTGELQDVLRFIEGGGEARRAKFEAAEAEYMNDQRRIMRRMEQQTRVRGMGGWAGSSQSQRPCDEPFSAAG